MSFRSVASNEGVLAAVLVRGSSLLAYETLLLGGSLAIFEAGGSALDTGALFASAVLPTMLLAPVVGFVLDSSRPRPFILSIVGATTVALAVAALLDNTSTFIPLVVLAAIGHSFISAGCQAVLPTLVSEEREVAEAVGLSQSVSVVAASVSPVIAGLLVGLWGSTGLLVAIGAVYAVVFLTVTQSNRIVASPGSGPEANLGELVAGFRFLWFDRTMAGIVGLMLVLVLLLGATDVVEVFMLRGELNATPTEFGLLAAAWTVGTLIGSRLAVLGPAQARAFGTLVIGATFAGTATAVVGSVQGVIVAAGALFVGGCGNGLLSVCAGIAVLTRSPSSLRGRASSAMSASVNGAVVASYGLGAVAAIYFTPREIYVMAGGSAAFVTLAVASLIAVTARTPRARSTRRGAAQPARADGCADQSSAPLPEKQTTAETAAEPKPLLAVLDAGPERSRPAGTRVDGHQS